MYLGIDVGGTKTLVASLNDEGVIQEEYKFPTPKLYGDFIGQLTATVNKLTTQDFRAAGIGIPGVVDRKHGIGERFGNLPWRNVPVQADLSALTGCPVVLENDAKMAALSEAGLEAGMPVVLYVTIGTGIGIAVVSDGVIDASFGDTGGKTLMLERNGRFVPWESFASGRAIYERFGKKASEIDDAATWQVIAHDICLGLIDLIALAEPDLVVIGGGIGTHFPKYQGHLEALLQAQTANNALLVIPPLKAAVRPEKAVVYGCYELARSLHGHAATIPR